MPAVPFVLKVTSGAKNKTKKKTKQEVVLVPKHYFATYVKVGMTMHFFMKTICFLSLEDYLTAYYYCSFQVHYQVIFHAKPLPTVLDVVLVYSDL